MQERVNDSAVMETKVGNLPADVNFDHIVYASDNNKNQETINKLKSMIILHLEVIKEQADKLLHKDKLIAKLKQENEELRQKVETAAATAATSTTGKSGRGRTPRKTPVRSPAKVDGDVKRSTPNKRRSKKSLDADSAEPKPKQAKLEPVQAEVVSSEESPESRQIVVITSDKPYLACEWKKTVAELDAEREPQLRAMLEIPSWEERDLAPLYMIDGTEDLSDEAFMKRHQKHEIHEKRRKRWDVQRIREVRTVEKLRQRYMKEEIQEEKLKVKPLLSSFYPPVDALKLIHIVEQLPVLAFGEPIPQLPTQDFFLPWQKSPDVTMSPSTSFTKTRFFKKN